MSIGRAVAESPAPTPQYPSPLASPLHELPPSLRSRASLPVSTEDVSLRDILSAVLRQEVALREEHVRLRGLLQHQYQEITERMADLNFECRPIPITTFTPEPMVSAAPLNNGVYKPAVVSPLNRVVTPQNNGAIKPAVSNGSDAIEIFRPDDTIKFAKAMSRAHARAVEAEVETTTQIPTEEEEAGTGLSSYIKRVVMGHYFELMMGAVILINMCTTAIQLQWQGYALSHDLGIRSDDASWSSAKNGFHMLEVVYNIIYLVEVTLRIMVFRCRFFRSYFNLLDSLIVLSTCTETFVLQPLEGAGGGMISLSALRIMRFFRVFRMGRMAHMLHTMERLREMRILIQTLIVSVRGLFWSVLLIGGICLAASIVMVQVCHGFLDDESISEERRIWIYNAFGTTARASLTVFECTFTGQWPKYSGPFIEEVSSAFALFFLPFVVLVNFAVMRVVAALFLKETMRVADAESGLEEALKMKEKASVASDLKKVFMEADTSANGAISQEEFYQMLSNENVVAHLTHLDIEIDEAVALFGVLCADDGEADYEEFLNGALKVNGSAKTIDTLQILHQVLEMNKLLEKINGRLP
jgi:hypothetical protein